VELNITLPAGFLSPGTYSVDLALFSNSNGIRKREFNFSDELVFSLPEQTKNIGSWLGKKVGYINPNFNWH
jgi:hypothetical protein